MKTELNQLVEFHETYHSYINYQPTTEVPKEVFDLRMELITEELKEFQEAYADKNLVEIADALGDVAYVLFGTVLAFGLQDKFNDLFHEIHRSNMSKLDKNGEPIFREDGKVLKGPDYFKPDIKGVLEA